MVKGSGMEQSGWSLGLERAREGSPKFSGKDLLPRNILFWSGIQGTPGRVGLGRMLGL